MIPAVSRINAEIARLEAIFNRRGIFYEDEQARLDAFREVRGWIMGVEEAKKKLIETVVPFEDDEKPFGGWRTRQRTEGAVK
jgi:hypothetical protein